MGVACAVGVGRPELTPLERATAARMPVEVVSMKEEACPIGTGGDHTRGKSGWILLTTDFRRLP